MRINPNGMLEGEADLFLAPEHLAQLKLSSPKLARIVVLHGAYDTQVPLIVGRDKDHFIAACDVAHPDGEPTFLARLRENVFLPVEADSFWYIGQ